MEVIDNAIALSADFWLNLQNAWEIYHAQAAEIEQLEKIKPWVMS